MNDVVIKKKYSFRLNALTVQLRIYILEQRIGMSVSGWEMGGGERQGLGLRNNVLTTCKAVTLCGGQRIIPVFFPQ